MTLDHVASEHWVTVLIMTACFSLLEYSAGISCTSMHTPLINFLLAGLWCSVMKALRPGVSCCFLVHLFLMLIPQPSEIPLICTCIQASTVCDSCVQYMDQSFLFFVFQEALFTFFGRSCPFVPRQPSPVLTRSGQWLVGFCIGWGTGCSWNSGHDQQRSHQAEWSVTSQQDLSVQASTTGGICSWQVQLGAAFCQGTVP